jgi:hypothetical protein
VAEIEEQIKWSVLLFTCECLTRNVVLGQVRNANQSIGEQLRKFRTDANIPFQGQLIEIIVRFLVVLLEATIEFVTTVCATRWTSTIGKVITAPYLVKQLGILVLDTTFPVKERGSSRREENNWQICPLQVFQHT